MAINDADHTTTATTARDISAVGSATFTAVGSSATGATTWAGTAGAPGATSGTPLGSVNDQANRFLGLANSLALNNAAGQSKDSTTPVAGTSASPGAPLSVAATISFNLVTTRSDVTLPGNVTVTVTGGALTLESMANTDASAVADGETGTNGAIAAIGAGIAMNVATFTNTADVAPGAKIDADGLTLSATMRPISDDESGDCETEGTDCTNSIGAEAVSAASGGGTLGVAGSVAINIASGTTSAQLQSSGDTASRVNAHAGDVSLEAVTGVEQATSATAFQDTFDPADSILPDSEGNLTTIQLPYALTDGNLQTGDAVVYRSGGGNPMGVLNSTALAPSRTLVDNRTYYVIVVRPGYIELANSSLEALAHRAIILDPSQATGNRHYLVPEGGNPTVGIGASFALSIDNVTTSAGIQNAAVLDGGDNLDIAAEDDNSVDTETVSGTAGTNALSPSVALTMVNLTTSASIGTGNGIEVAGDVTVAAAQTSETKTESSGDIDAEGLGLALAIALAVVSDDVHAVVSRDLHAHGPITVTASGSSANESESEAAAPGGPSETYGGITAAANGILAHGNTVSIDNTGKSASKTETPIAGTSDSGGSLSVAGAVTIDIVTTSSNASFADGLTIGSDEGNLTLASSANTDVIGIANGSTKAEASAGIGAGVVVNDVNISNIATTGASALSAQGLVVSAGMTEVESEEEAVEPEEGNPVEAEEIPMDTTHTVSATAIAGSSNGEKLGAAGALALNIVTARTEARVPTGASVEAGAGDIAITATYSENDIAEATSKAGFKTCAQVLGLPCDLSSIITGADDSGSGIGVGASVAVQTLTSTVTVAQIDDGVIVSNGNDVTVTADSTRRITTIAEAGSKGGTAISPAVALVVDAGDSASARIGTAASGLDVTGTVTVAATHSVDLTATNANANVLVSEARGVGVGAAVALPLVVEWTTSAELARDTMAESVAISAESRAAGQAIANASSVGIPSTGADADETATHTVANDPNAGGKGADTVPSANDAANKGGAASGSKAGKSGGGVGIAAAIGVLWLQTTNTARIAPDIVVRVNGPVSVTATQLTTATAKGTGIALSAQSTNVSAGVGFNYVDVVNDATVGDRVAITAGNIVVTAGTPLDSDGHPLENDFIVWGFAAAGGSNGAQVAGSAGINVVMYQTAARVGAGAHLTATGDLTPAGDLVVSAATPMGLQNLAVSGALGASGAAVGAAIAINIVDATTTAVVDSSSATPTSLNATGAIDVRADASLSPLGIDLTLLGASILSNLVNIPGVVLISAPDGQTMTPAVSSVAVSGAAGTGPLAASGSFIVDVWNRSTDAHIGHGTVVNAGQTVTVTAADDTPVVNVAGSLGVTADSAGVGVAVIVGVMDKDVRAYLDSMVTVAAGSDVTIAASANEPILAIAASAGAAGETGVAGSIIALVMNQVSDQAGTYASIDGGAGQASTVHAGGNLSVTAQNSTDRIELYAGGVAMGGTAGAGIASATLVRTSTVEATIGDNDDVSSAGAIGVTVAADQHPNLTLIAIGGAGGGETGIAGSATVLVLTDVTTASIGDSALVNCIGTGCVNPATTPQSSVTVTADDATVIVDAAGQLAIGGDTGVGVGADVQVVHKTTSATIGADSRVQATGDVLVISVSSESITSISAGAIVGGSVAVGINAAVPVIDITTTAAVGDRTTVLAGGNVIVSADEQLTLMVVAGNLSVSGSASVGAGAAVPVVIKTTNATIGDGAQVTALAQSTGTSSVNSGEYIISATNPGFDPRDGLLPYEPGDPGAMIELGYDANFASGQQVVYDAAGGVPIVGLTSGQTYYVIPVTSSRIMLSLTPRGPPLCASDCGPGLIPITGLSLPATGLMGENQRFVPTTRPGVLSDTTPRFNPATDVADDVVTLPYLIAGLNTGDQLLYSAGGGTAIGGLVDGQTYYVTLLDAGAYGAQRITLAASEAGPALQLDPIAATGRSHSLVRPGSLPAADASATSPQTVSQTQTNVTGVAVTATNSDNVSAIGISGGFSGSVAVNVSGTVAVVLVNTTATIGAGARINSDHSVVVVAGNSFRQLGIATSLSLAGDVGVGAGVGVRVVSLNTAAHIGDNALVDARDAITVTATGQDAVISAVAAAAGAIYAGVAGAVTVTVLTVNTGASTGVGVDLRAGEAIEISANDDTSLILITASLGAAIAGIGASVDVAVVTKTTTAHLGSSNTIVVLGAAGLTVRADSTEDAIGVAFGLGGGLVGVAGVVGVHVFTITTNAYVDAETTVNSGGGKIIAGVASGQGVTVSATDSLHAFTIAGGIGDAGFAAAGGVDIGVANVSVQAYLGTETDVWASGTVRVMASAQKRLHSIAVSFSEGLASVAGAVSVWAVGTQPTATYQQNNQGPNRGTWSSSTAYRAGDVVSRDGHTYGARQNNTGHDPSEAGSEYWVLSEQNPTVGTNGSAQGMGDTAASGQNSGATVGWGSILSGSSSPAWASGTRYAVGTVVVYNGVHFQARTGIDGSTTAPDVDATHWLNVQGQARYQSDGTGAANKAIAAAGQKDSVVSDLFTQNPPAGTSAGIYGTVHSGGDVDVIAHDSVDMVTAAGIVGWDSLPRAPAYPSWCWGSTLTPASTTRIRQRGRHRGGARDPRREH